MPLNIGLTPDVGAGTAEPNPAINEVEIYWEDNFTRPDGALSANPTTTGYFSDDPLARELDPRWAEYAAGVAERPNMAWLDSGVGNADFLDNTLVASGGRIDTHNPIPDVPTVIFLASYTAISLVWDDRGGNFIISGNDLTLVSPTSAFSGRGAILAMIDFENAITWRVSATVQIAKSLSGFSMVVADVDPGAAPGGTEPQDSWGFYNMYGKRTGYGGTVEPAFTVATHDFTTHDSATPLFWDGMTDIDLEMTWEAGEIVCTATQGATTVTETFTGSETTMGPNNYVMFGSFGLYFLDSPATTDLFTVRNFALEITR